MSTKRTDAADIEIAQLTDRLMRRIHGRLNATASDFDRHRIGPAGGLLLLTLADHEPARIQDIVQHLARDKSQITRGIQLLEGKGLIARRHPPEDARVSLLSLTETGHATVAAIQGAVALALDDILAPLSSADRGKLKEILRAL